MLATSTLLIILVALSVGIAIGFLINKATHPNEQERKKLEEELQKSRDELVGYQHQVTAHFVETSSQFSDLTQQYRQLHEHLAQGAMDLANPEVSRQIAAAGDNQLGTEDSISFTGDIPAPPKDYAPKVPGGVLSEAYGLRDDENKTASPATVVNLDLDAEDDQEEDPTLKVG